MVRISLIQDQMGRAKADNEKIKNDSSKKSAEIKKLSGQLERTKIQLEKKNKSDKGIFNQICWYFIFVYFRIFRA